VKAVAYFISPNDSQLAECLQGPEDEGPEDQSGRAKGKEHIKCEIYGRAFLCFYSNRT